AGLEPFIDTLVVCTLTTLVILLSGAWNRGPEALFTVPEQVRIVAAEGENKWTLETSALPAKTAEAKRILSVQTGPGWRVNETVFMVVQADLNDNTETNLIRVGGSVVPDENESWNVKWNTFDSSVEPSLRVLPDGSPDLGVYGDYVGAALTGHAFDRVMPGLGMWLVTIACWLFAISTMISWGYYGEQGVIYLLGKEAVLFYKLTYCMLIIIATLGFIKTDEQLDEWTALGTGVMLFANIPIMLIFGAQAMRAYHDYIHRLKTGKMDPPHAAPKLTDVIEGRDVQ
ncbi:MAG TPA: alanine:cation symporter family protein, partial [Phycisphaerales bacterium]|nr:alanine:cation symporter family protein [Phycisphaerales bacterium]